jgi:hypothetical protein
MVNSNQEQQLWGDADGGGNTYTAMLGPCQLAVSATASQLLLQLLNCGLLEGCKAAVHQQLREHLQQPQQQNSWGGLTEERLQNWQGGHTSNQFSTSSAVGINLASFGGIEVVKGVVVATMRPCMLLLLLLTAGRGVKVAGSKLLNGMELLPQWIVPEGICNATIGEEGGMGAPGLAWWSKALFKEVDAAMRC